MTDFNPAEIAIETQERNPAHIVSHVAGWLGHPLLLIVVGALLTNYLIPIWVNESQDRQKALEVKVALVDRINTSVTEMVMAVQFAILRAGGQTQQEYDEAYFRWEINRAVIYSQLLAYFPDTAIPARWNALSEGVTVFYATSGATDPDKQREYLSNWVNLKAELIADKDALVQEILATSISVF